MERLLAKIRPQLVQLQEKHATAFAQHEKYDFYQTWSNNCRELVARIDRRDVVRLRDLCGDLDVGREARELIWNEVMILFETLDTLGIFDTLAEILPAGRVIIIQREALARVDPPLKRQRLDPSDERSSSVKDEEDKE